MLRLRLGGIECDRAIVEHVSGAVVLVYGRQRRMAMTVRQTCDAVLYPGQPAFPEAIAGVTECEAPADTARREALEETGISLRHVEPVGHVDDTIDHDRTGLPFLAEYEPTDRIGIGGGIANELEKIDAREEPLADLWFADTNGQVVDAKLFMP